MKYFACVLLVCGSCSTIAPIIGGATGAATGAALGGPGGAAAGAALGVATAEAVFPDETISGDAALEAAKHGHAAPGSSAEFIEKITNLLQQVGWWYLLLFIVAPLLTKRGRKWIKQKCLPKKEQIFFKLLQIQLEENPHNNMKYIINEENSCGQATLTDDLRNMVLESLGIAPNKKEASQQITESVASETEVEDTSDMPTLYEWDGAVFALDDEVFEIEGDLFLKAIELDNETRMGLDESHAELFINEVRFDAAPFTLGDIYDFGDEIFIKLDEGEKKGDKSKDKPGDKGDYETGARKGDEGAGKDKDDKPDFTTDQRKGDKSKTHSGRDFENGNGNGKGDPRAFGGKKGDKSKTHGGLDFKSLKKKAKK